MLSLLALVAAAATPVSGTIIKDRAGNSFVHLEVKSAPTGNSQNNCFNEKYCININLDNFEIRAINASNNDDYLPIDFTKTENAEYEIWPNFVSYAPGSDNQETYLFGIIENSNTSYSGGGSQVSKLKIYELVINDGVLITNNFLFEAPIYGNKLIRACFNDAQMQSRRGICHDEYNFNASLRLDTENSELSPAFFLDAIAQTFPTALNIENDNSNLKVPEGEIKPIKDDICSYNIRIKYNPMSGKYEPEKELPVCGQYLVQ